MATNKLVVTELREVSQTATSIRTVTIGDSSVDEEWVETDPSWRDVCPSSCSRCFLNYEISI